MKVLGAVLFWGALFVGLECLAVVPLPRQFVKLDGTVRTNVDVVCRRVVSVPREGYRLEVGVSGVKIDAADDAGFFYARQTLRQLESHDCWPCCRIVDEPRYAWRGLHLDVSRHFFGKDAVKRFLDKAAEYKFNVFHWHLMDDQGCRLPIDNYPRMKSIGATRPSPDYSRWIQDFCDPGQYGPFFYTREDILEIVRHAESLHITIVPEIEFPGHSREVLLAYPEFFCSDRDHLRQAVTMCNAKGAPLKYGAEPALNCSALCLGNDAVIDFAKGLVDLVCELFPGKFIHIGGDECDKANWRQCPRCQARMRSVGLKTEEDLQAWGVRQIVDYISKKHRRAIGWEEVMQGGLAKDVAVMSWLGPRAGIEAAMSGHDVVMATHTNCYFCYTQELPDDERFIRLPPGVVGHSLPLKSVYTFDPSADVPGFARAHILGGQGFVWTEQTPNEEWMQWQVWPRALAMSEVLWSGTGCRSFEVFCQEVDSIVRKMRQDGFNAAHR